MKSLKVRDCMTADLVTFTLTTNVVDAMDLLLKHGISGAPVVDEEGALVGIVSEVDLIQVVVQDSYYNEPVGIVADFMRSNVETVTSDTDIFTLAEKFIREHRRRYPVVDGGVLVGQISRRDVLHAASEFRPKTAI
ncbi:MAG: CBS domain-containing protein [Pseudomonadales bacterium]|jgi:CBS domain-containing protein|nr:CBS domain-containing protein [Pseudomonadales bacterium]